MSSDIRTIESPLFRQCKDAEKATKAGYNARYNRAIAVRTAQKRGNRALMISQEMDLGRTKCPSIDLGTFKANMKG